MSSLCAAIRYGAMDSLAVEAESLRGRYQTLLVRRSTPIRKAEVAHIGVKLAELLHLLVLDSATAREARAIPVLASWISGRIDMLETQGRIPPQFLARA